MANGAAVYENGEEEIPQINGKKPRNIFLDHFNKLTSVAPKIRLKSGCQIIRHLGRNNENNEELNYTLGRLIRGLGSSKTNSRIGFYTTFVVLLKSSNKVDVDGILDVVQKELKTSGQNLKSENADIYTGLILVCGAVLQSGKFASLKNEKRKALLQHLVDASTKKRYLGLLAASMIIDALPKLGSKVVFSDILPALRPELKKPLSEYTIDQLYLLLKLEEHYPTVLTPKLLGNLIKTQKILTEGNVNGIVHVLLDVQPSKSISAHPIYAYLAKKFVESSYLPKILGQFDADFEQFTTAKHQVLAVLLKHVVDRLSEEENVDKAQYLPLVFGKNFLINTVRHFKATTVKQQDDVKQAVVRLLNSTSNWSKMAHISSEIKVKVMEQLMFYPGVFTFEKITGNKVLQSITSSLDVDGVKNLSEIYRKVMLAEVPKTRYEGHTENWTNLDRIYAGQLIVKLINHPAMKQEHEWRVQQLLLLLEVGLLKTSSVGGDLQKCLKETFFSALDCKFGKLQDVIQCASRLVHALNENMCGNNLRQPLEGEVRELWDKSHEMIETFERKSAKKKELNDVFHTLFLQMSLQLFNDEKLAGDSLRELFSCYANCKRKAKDEELAWIEVVVDLFLNLLSHSSHLLRRVVGAVFPHLCKHLTTSALHQILHVVDAKSEANPLSVNVDDSEDDDEADESEEEAETDEDDEDDSVDDDDDEMDTQNDQLRLALQDVLMKSSQDDDNESVDLDDMSDSEAEKLNAALGEAFKQFRPEAKRKSKKQSKDDATLTHFRVRVMDLIDIYLDSPEVSMINALEIMLPLLQGLEFSIRDAHQKPLHDRIKTSLKKLAALKTFASTEDVDENVLHTLLRSILDKGTKSSLIVQEMGDRIADCSMFIINCSASIQATKKVSALLVEVVDVFFKKRDCLTPYALFKMILASNWKKCVVLIGPLASYVFDDEIRPFRRRQALELLKIFYLNNRLSASHKRAFEKRLAKCEEKLRADVMHFLEAKEYASKEPFVIGVFLLVAALKNSCLQTAFTADWAKVGELAREYRSGIALTGDGKAAFVKLCHALKISNVVKMQARTVKLNLVNRDAGDDKDDDEAKETASRKTNTGEKQPKQLKKEARALRMQSLSDGLPGQFNFAQADVDELHENGVDNDDDQSGDDCAEEQAVEVKSNLNGARKDKRSKKRTTSEASHGSLAKKKKTKRKAL